MHSVALEMAVREIVLRLIGTFPFSIQRRLLSVIRHNGLGPRLLNDELSRLDHLALAVKRPDPILAVAKAGITAIRAISPHNFSIALAGQTRARHLIVSGGAWSDFEFISHIADIARDMANSDTAYKTIAPRIAVNLALRVERERLRLTTSDRQRTLVISNLLAILEHIHRSDVKAAQAILTDATPALLDEHETAGALAVRILKTLNANLSEEATVSPELFQRIFPIVIAAVGTSRDFSSGERLVQKLAACGQSAFGPIRANYVLGLEELLRVCGNFTRIEHPAPLQDPENCIRMQTDADLILSPWRQSLGYKLVTQREERTRASAAINPDNASSGSKILFVSNSYWFFLSEVIQSLEQTSGVQCRTFDFGIAQHSYGLSLREAALPQLDGQSSNKIQGDAFDIGLFKRLLDWADVIFVEWCEWAAVWLSDYLPTTKRLIIRLHSYEAFSATPHFINWANVDSIVFVADHIRRFFNVQLGERLEQTAQLVIDNIRDLSAFRSHGSADRDFILGMVGYNNANKNPRMAVAILRSLRALDDRWQLRLVGPAWADDNQLPSYEREYKSEFFADIDAFGLADAVVFTGQVSPDDVNRAMLEIGVILSCSDREGTHEAVVEGIASGCVPLIRNWPTSAAYDGARTAFAAFQEFVFDNVEEAVSKARSHGSPDSLARHTLAQRGLETFDKRATIAGLLNLFFPSEDARHHPAPQPVTSPALLASKP